MKLNLGPVHSLILSCLLITIELFQAFGAPVGDINNSIKKPCKVPVNITTENKKTSKDTISYLLVLVNEANSLARTSKLEMTQAIGSYNMTMDLDRYNYFNIVNAEEIKVGLDIKKSLGQLFKSNFRNFSELVIYTDLAADDAAANHAVKIKDVLEKLKDILCWLQIGTLSQGESLTHYLNTSINNKNNSSPEEILFRNYIIIRDVGKNLEQFSLLYKYIKDTL
ncbi:hypothetical protein CHS0354_041159 [Potamilus streckersoni]|uniref:Uncharacterized protein n=1 Tax=Potamilus streckersoni TaxID=2493646 RepID=A0AAE0SE06_9BIVA|nr:hypothetical protein CHS0354_041159 [Potamilus streckersoni]